MKLTLFFIKETAIALTGQTLASLYNINLNMAGLCWSDNSNYCYKYNTSSVSLAVVFDLISFYFSSLAD